MSVLLENRRLRILQDSKVAFGNAFLVFVNPSELPELFRSLNSVAVRTFQVESVFRLDDISKDKIRSSRYGDVEFVDLARQRDQPQSFPDCDAALPNKVIVCDLRVSRS